MIYTKQAFDNQAHTARLKERGMLIPDGIEAIKALSAIGYYHFSAYTLPFESGKLSDGTRDHRLSHQVQFSHILGLYEFDHRLRRHVMSTIERIEVALRTRWADEMALKCGPHGYLDSANFQNVLKHAEDLVKVGQEIIRSREPFVEHYKARYGDPVLPPVWAIVETFSLGQLSRWFQNTKETGMKRDIMRYFGMPTVEAFEGVLHALTPVSNLCAHHGRLWNRRFTLRLPGLRSLGDSLLPHREGNPADLLIHNYLVVIAYMLERLGQDGDWLRILTDLLQERDTWELSLMGFTDGWQDRQPWKRVAR